MVDDPTPHKKRGQRPKINPARMSKILKSLEAGNFFKVAAPASGVHVTTAYLWLSKGEEALSSMRVSNPEIDAEIADWLEVWPDNFNQNNGMWDAPVPSNIDPAVWLYVLFVILAQKASAKAEEKAVKNIMAAGKKYWQASAWYLERTHRDRYGRSAIPEAERTNEGNQLVAASDEELVAKIKQLRAQRQLAQGTDNG